MTEYINRQAALDAILKEPTDAHYPSWYAEKIKALPAVDVVQVARCKECRYAVSAWEDVYACTRPYHLVSGDHFCAFGVHMGGGASNG